VTGFKIDDSTHVIRNIVFMRDPNELELGTNYMNQREAFSHQNDLNIRDLRVKREFMQEERDLSPQMKAAIRLNR